MIRKTLKAIALACVILAVASCGGSRRQEVAFNYGKILKNEFESGVGRVIPVTIEQSTDMDGVFTDRGLFFFFTSDREGGNFDLYLRTLSGITTVRLTSHPSKDFSPAVSPDGKSLAFVSQREDPEGDVLVVSVDPADLLGKAEKSVTDLPTLDRKTKNLTLLRDPATGFIRIAKDSTPAWSPDGEKIAFSSTRDGIENIWIMDRDGANPRRLTAKGGLYPRFSADGGKIAFISYRDAGSNGDVYTLDLKTGAESRVTSTPSIELYPAFAGDSHTLVYTLIDRDTNADGRVDLKDNSVLYCKNLSTRMEYPLTARSQSSFAASWSRALKVLNPRYFDVLVFTDQVGQNININIIPADGVIPRKVNAEAQYGLAERYLKEYDDRERYNMALERVYHFFGARKDERSSVFVAKALVDAAVSQLKTGGRAEAMRLRETLSGLSSDSGDYRAISARYLDAVLEGKSGEQALSSGLERLSANPARRAFVPYLMEELGDEYVRAGRFSEAVNVYRGIKKSHPSYDRMVNVGLKIGEASYRTVSPDIPGEYLDVINSKNVYLGIDAVNNILDVFDRESDVRRKIDTAAGILKKTEGREGEKIAGVMMYLLGDGYRRSGNRPQAINYLEKALKNVNRSNLVYYRASRMLGDMAHAEGRLDDMEKHYFNSVTNYIMRWKQKDLPDMLGRLVEYYENRGVGLEREGKNREAATLFRKYVDVLSFVHLLRQYDDIYSKYGSRAHILYVDASTRGVKNEREALGKLETEYVKKVDAARMNFDKARLYGLAYIYAKTGITFDRGGRDISSSDLNGMLENFRKSVDQVDWALFMDDTYVDPYMLKGWIAQYVDLRRRDLEGGSEGVFRKYFPRYLWEANVPFYERALAANDESRYADFEGNIHLNLANTFFLLSNYPSALRHYELALRYKRVFGSLLEEAMFRFHLGFCYWQDNRIEKARAEMQKTLMIYHSLAQARGMREYSGQIYALYRYFALFSRVEGQFRSAIDWYNRILAFASANSIPVDRARYLQEIAWCHYRLGETASALEHLDRADTALEGRSETVQRHRLRMRLLGIGPIPLFDLGPDVAVIGDNRIYTELNVANKKLLNLSIRESIASGRGDYAAAIALQRKKLQAWEEGGSRLDHEGVVRELNNMGYTHFLMRDYPGARDHFKKAWDYAAKKSVNDMAGVFRSIMNLSDLYALLIDSGDAPVEEGELRQMIARIGEYRDSYEGNRYKAEIESLEADAKAKKKEGVTEEQKKQLRSQIAEEAKNIYYSTDIASGVLSYYLAEHVIRGGTSSSDPMEILRGEGALFSLYRDALVRFTRALAFAEAQPSKRLAVRLLLNVAEVQTRIGKIQEAYETLTRAEAMAKKHSYLDITWVVYGRMGEFLERDGRAVEGAGHQSLAGQYFAKAFDEIEECPPLYARQAHQVENLYERYARVLLKRNAWARAHSLLERKASMSRIMGLSGISIEPAGGQEQDLYRRHRAAAREVSAAVDSLSSLAESGEGDDSPKVAHARKTLSAARGRYRDAAASMKRSGALFASFFTLPDAPSKAPDGATVYRFEKLDGVIAAWKAGPAISFTTISAKAPGKRDGELICDYLQEESKGDRGRRFVVLNRLTAETLLGEKRISKAPPFTFVQSLERAAHYMPARAGQGKSLYHSGEGLARRLSGRPPFTGMKIDEGPAGTRDLASYDLIVDAAPSPVLELSLLYGKRLRSGLVVRKVEPFNAERIVTIADALLFAGARSVVFIDGADGAAVADILASAEAGPLDALNASSGLKCRMAVVGNPRRTAVGR